MRKEHILSEIKRTAEENGGNPLGINKFFAATGIKKEDWYGKYWTKWSDAQTEAGYEPNTLQVPYDEEWLIEQLAIFIREIGKYPTKPELKMKCFNSKGFPDVSTFYKRLGSKSQMACKVVHFCDNTNGFDDVKILADKHCKEGTDVEPVVDDADIDFGFVYLMKSGKYYKIGRSNSTGRRNYELNVQMPEDVILIHEIKTDDPVGIEAYWHQRFSEQRKKGEWFLLSAKDVGAFMRRKFI